MTRAFYSIVYDIVFLIERKINYFILFLFIFKALQSLMYWKIHRSRQPATSTIQKLGTGLPYEFRKPGYAAWRAIPFSRRQFHQIHYQKHETQRCYQRRFRKNRTYDYSRIMPPQQLPMRQRLHCKQSREPSLPAHLRTKITQAAIRRSRPST